MSHWVVLLVNVDTIKRIYLLYVKCWLYLVFVDAVWCLIQLAIHISKKVSILYWDFINRDKLFGDLFLSLKSLIPSNAYSIYTFDENISISQLSDFFSFSLYHCILLYAEDIIVLAENANELYFWLMLIILCGDISLSNADKLVYLGIFLIERLVYNVSANCV